jgi:hypothetical protein
VRSKRVLESYFGINIIVPSTVNTTESYNCHGDQLHNDVFIVAIHEEGTPISSGETTGLTIHIPTTELFEEKAVKAIKQIALAKQSSEYAATENNTTKATEKEAKAAGKASAKAAAAKAVKGSNWQTLRLLTEERITNASKETIAIFG